MSQHTKTHDPDMAHDLTKTQLSRAEVPVGGHKHRHGKPASWVLVGVVIAAFIAGAFAVVFRAWPVFWVCAGIVVVSFPAGKAVGIMNDTVMVDDWLHDSPPAADRGSVANPGVRMDMQ
jgi:hypothetical protein